MESAQQNSKKFYAHGKLLLSSEYFVLDGAIAIALPCRLGQTLSVDKNSTGYIHWKSIDKDQNIWFESKIYPHQLEQQFSGADDVLQRIISLLQAIRAQNPTFLQENFSCSMTFQLEFPRLWGLGTSSTLIALLSNWTGTDPYQLLAATFGGSGYDLACASAENAIQFQLLNSRPQVSKANFDPPFIDQLYFVYLEKKQNSRSGIQLYKSKGTPSPALIDDMNALSIGMTQAENLESFEDHIRKHELFLSNYLGLPTVQGQLFTDYWGCVKSLGAWGGDFALVTSDRSADSTQSYFRAKGYTTFLPYRELVLC